MRRWRVAPIVALAACGRIGFDAGDAGSVLVPRCDDAFQNGDETGIDCGGSCPLRCPLAPCSVDADCVTARCQTTCQLADLAWQPGPSLTFARYRHDCATRSDGTVFVVGGRASASVALASVEVLLPGATTFTAGPPLQTARQSHAVAVGADDTVYAALGGPTGTTGSVLSVESLAATGSAWLSGPDGVSQLGIRGAVAADGRLYLPDSNGTGVYDPAQQSWLAVAPPLGVDDYGLALGDDRRHIYAVGGLAGPGDSTFSRVFDIDAQTWSSRADLLSPRSESAAVTAPDGRIYAIGGLQGTTALAVVDAYSPAVDAWLAVPPLQHARDWPCATLAGDGRIFAIGGLDTSNSEPTTTSELYGPQLTLVALATATRTTITAMGAGFAPGAPISIAIDGTLVASSTTTAAGAATLSFALPAGPPGKRSVVARDAHAQYPVSAVLSVP